MKNRRRLALMMLAVLTIMDVGFAEAMFDGTVVAGETTTVLSSIGGTVESVNLRQGAWIEAGEAIASVATNKVFASVDGTVRGVFAEQGDSAENAVLYIAPVSKYTVSATITKAYSSAATKYVTIGETVYMSCTADGTHKAVGHITAVEGSNFTVEVTGGELYMEETVYIYRKESYASSSRVGSGTVSRTNEIAVMGSGNILKLYVSDGEAVERGQLLFETVESTAKELETVDGEIASTVSGVVASIDVQVGQKIEAGATLLAIYPDDSFRVELSIAEDELSSIVVGDEVSLYFNWDEDNGKSTLGTVSEISYLAETTEDGLVTYKAYVDFDASAEVRLGMTVSASVLDD